MGITFIKSFKGPQTIRHGLEKKPDLVMVVFQGKPSLLTVERVDEKEIEISTLEKTAYEVRAAYTPLAKNPEFTRIMVAMKRDTARPYKPTEVGMGLAALVFFVCVIAMIWGK